MDLISTRAHAMVMHVVRSVMSWQAQQVARLKSSNLSQKRNKILNLDTMLVKTIFDFTCVISNTTVFANFTRLRIEFSEVLHMITSAA